MISPTVCSVCLLFTATAVRAQQAEHWSFEVPREAALPRAIGSEHPIDRFVNARLAAQGIELAPRADRATLARRASLALTGLPPAPDDVDALVEDPAPDAFERYIDRLLDSPHYGEQQASWWLDVARYADTNGYEKDRARTLWPWRDWVIEAFARDMPFDEFTVKQLAGDLLPAPSRDDLVATGFHRNSMLNDEGGIDAEEFRVVAVKDRVDATARTWLGLTLDCAQCHDHKYDPISQREYYAFYAFFDQTQDVGVGADPTLRVPGGPDGARARRLLTELDAARASYTGRDAGFVERFAAWLPGAAAAAQKAELKAPRLGTWQYLGPILTGDAAVAFDREFAPERRVTLERPQAGQRWTPRPEWNDGAVHPLPEGDAAVHYLWRVIDVPAASNFTISLGSDDSLKVFANGDQILAREVTRAAMLDQELVDVPLRAGRNELLLKVVNGAGPAGFAFALRPAQPDDVRQLLLRAPDSWIDADRARVEDWFRSIDPALASSRDGIASLEQRLAGLELPATMVLRERTAPRSTRVLARGQWDAPGAEVEPDVPGCLPSLPADAPRNRLGLARWLVAPENPLTARVIVDRIWGTHFGRGLVPTPDDFGTRGQPPTHPELLDWLAVRFVRGGWSIKSMHRLIVTSDTWQRAAVASSRQLARDPTNLGLAWFPRHRLTFEQLRDTALAAAGLLDRSIGGPSAMPPQPPGIWENSFAFHDLPDRWETAEDERRFRRGLYVYLRRTALYPTWRLFDGPMRDVSCVRRARTNTPLQALAILNDPAFVEAAGALGRRVCDESDGVEARVERAFRLCVARRPDLAERGELRALFDAARARFAAAPSEARRLLEHARVDPGAHDPRDVAALVVVANAILNLDETVTQG